MMDLARDASVLGLMLYHFFVFFTTLLRQNSHGTCRLAQNIRPAQCRSNVGGDDGKHFSSFVFTVRVRMPVPADGVRIDSLFEST